MKNRYLLLGLLLLSACAAEDAEDTHGLLRGVVDPPDALAEVWVLDEGAVRVVARPSPTTGAFEVQLAPGTYDLLVSADGYLRDDSLTDVEVIEGRVAEVGTVRLSRAGTGGITGRVEPAGVEAHVSVSQSGAVVASAKTDDAGDFFFTSLPVGSYELSVSAPGYLRYVASGVVAVAEATTTMVDPITLERSTVPVGAITGVVAPATSGATLTAFLAGEPVASVAAAEADGRFRLEGLAVGTYRVVAHAPAAGSASVDGVLVTAGQTNDIGTLALVAQLRRVGGLVLDLDTRAPVAGVLVTIGSTSASTGSDGRFELPAPPAGTSTLRMTRAYYVPGSELVTIPETGEVELPLTLAPAGRVEGVVRASGGAPLASARVESAEFTASTNAAGAYRLMYLRPGQHLIRAGLDGYAEAATLVEVVAGASTPVDFGLDRAGRVTGTIVDTATAAGLAGAIVRVGDDVAVTDAAGAYEIASTAQGSQTVAVSLAHYAPSSQPVSVPAGGSVTVNASLTAVARVSVTGVVRAPDGTPVAGARVYFGSGYDFDDTTDAAGAYQIPSAASGLLVPVDVRTVRVSASGYPSYEATVSLGSAAATVDITLEAYASVVGRVVDAATGEGIADVGVSCGSYTRTGADGSFVMPTVLPGTHSCWVSDGCVRYQPLSLTVGSGEHIEHTFVATRAADVLVHVRDGASLAPLSSAPVWTTGLDSIANVEGLAVLRCMAQGTQTVFASKPGYITGAARVLVPATGTVDAWLDLVAAP